jgi:cobalt-precorrin 5A hydrolase
MRVAGIGCRRGASAEEIEAVIALALERLESGAHGLDALATLTEKTAETGIAETARRLDLPLIACASDDLRDVTDRISTPSARVERATGLLSVAEAAALVAAGPRSRLIVPRIATARATCAIAEGPGR